MSKLKKLIRSIKEKEPVRDSDSLAEKITKAVILEDVKYERDNTVFHPSQFYPCPRSLVYQLIATTRSPVDSALQKIFDVGHYTHERIQNYVWKSGLLHGYFSCVVCGNYWLDTSPKECPKCRVKIYHNHGRALNYREFPIESEKYNIKGRIDGVIKDGETRALLEIKSCNSFLFKSYKFRPPDKYVNKVCVYRLVSGIDDVVILFENKDNSEWAFVTVPVDKKREKYIAEVLVEGKEGMEKKKLPCRVCKSRLDDLAAKCDHAQICFGGSSFSDLTNKII